MIDMTYTVAPNLLICVHVQARKMTYRTQENMLLIMQVTRLLLMDISSVIYIMNLSDLKCLGHGLGIELLL